MIRTLRAHCTALGNTGYTNTHFYSLYSGPWCHLHAGGVVVGVVVHHAVAADLLLAHAALLLVGLKTQHYHGHPLLVLQTIHRFHNRFSHMKLGR